MFLIPSLFFAINKYGAVGASFVWIIINIICLFIEVPTMHSKILKGSTLIWYFVDVFLPSTFIFIFVKITSLFLLDVESSLKIIIWISATFLISTLLILIYVIKFSNFLTIKILAMFSLANK